jgi:hypothetical protein
MRCNQWIATEKNTQSLACGHGVHNKCYHLIRQISSSYKWPVHCPECYPHWTRPHEFKVWQTLEKGNPKVQYPLCICETGNIRLYQQDGTWGSLDKTVEVLDCGHALHANCLKAVRRVSGEFCPLCPASPKEDPFEIPYLEESKRRAALQKRLLIKKETVMVQAGLIFILALAVLTYKDPWNFRNHLAVAIVFAGAVYYGASLSIDHVPFLRTYWNRS